MNRIFGWVILLPMALVVVVFAVTNTSHVPLDLWPLPYQAEMPLSVAVFAGFALGFVAGGIIVWIAGGKSRSLSRARARQLAGTERDLKELRKKIGKLETTPLNRMLDVLPSASHSGSGTAKSLPPSRQDPADAA